MSPQQASALEGRDMSLTPGRFWFGTVDWGAVDRSWLGWAVFLGLKLIPVVIGRALGGGLSG